MVEGLCSLTLPECVFSVTSLRNSLTYCKSTWAQRLTDLIWLQLKINLITFWRSEVKVSATNHTNTKITWDLLFNTPVRICSLFYISCFHFETCVLSCHSLVLLPVCFTCALFTSVLKPRPCSPSLPNCLCLSCVQACSHSSSDFFLIFVFSLLALFTRIYRLYLRPLLPVGLTNGFRGLGSVAHLFLLNRYIIALSMSISLYPADVCNHQEIPPLRMPGFICACLSVCFDTWNKVWINIFNN